MNLYATRRAAGLCTKCGAPSVPGGTLCDPHRVAHGRRTAADARAARAAHAAVFFASARPASPSPFGQFYRARRAAGLCVRCDMPALPGRPLCDVHREVNTRDSRERYRARADRPVRVARCTQCGEPGHNTRTCAAREAAP